MSVGKKKTNSEFFFVAVGMFGLFMCGTFVIIAYFNRPQMRHQEVHHSDTEHHALEDLESSLETLEVRFDKLAKVKKKKDRNKRAKKIKDVPARRISQDAAQVQHDLALMHAMLHDLHAKHGLGYEAAKHELEELHSAVEARLKLIEKFKS